MFEYLVFDAEYLNIQIYLFYIIRFGKSQNANLKNEDNLKKNTTTKTKITSNMTRTSKWRQPENEDDFKIEDDLKKENVILNIVPRS